MRIDTLPMGDLEENLHQMRVLQMYSQVMQPEIRKAIEFSIIMVQEEIRARKLSGSFGFLDSDE